MFSAGRIRKFFSLCNLLIIFVEKKDENDLFHLVVDYYGLNNIIILVRYFIPLINKL